MKSYGNLWKPFVNKLKFRKGKSEFQRQFRRNKSNRTIKVLVFADKTSNIYKLDADKYKTLTTEAIRSTYKKVPD